MSKPLVAGPVPAGLVGGLAVAALLACVPLSLLSGWRGGLAHLVAVALAWAYNLGLKATVWSWFPYAASFALLVTFISLGRSGHPGPPWWAATAAALLGVGAHLANVVPDLDDDAATGVRGLPHRIGAPGCVVGATTLMVAASAVVAFGPGVSGWTAAGLLVALLTTVAGLAASRGGRLHVLFRASLVVALVDVAMLVSRGSRL
jgi:4-hydroxybenzoate polyprenyltransferase